MTKRSLLAWVRRHPVPAFYLLVFGASWPLMVLMFSGLALTLPLQAVVGKAWAFCPALGALVIAAIEDPRSVGTRSACRWAAFVSGWLIAWLILVANARFVLGVTVGVSLLAAFGVSALLPAWVLASASSGTAGIRRQFSTLVRPKGRARWYLVALAIYPGSLLAGAWLTRAFGGAVGFRVMGAGRALSLPLLHFLEGVVASGGINEESGWRGFALRRLQARHSVLGATIAVWFFWALWHLPYDVGLGTPVGQMLLNRLGFNLVASILLTWVYNRSQGSVLAPALTHAAMNTAGAFLPVTLAGLLLLAAWAVSVVFVDRMWRALPADRQAE